MSKPAGKAAAKPVAPAAVTKVVLPQGSKEHKLFRDLSKCTDQRKFKRAIRCADTILKKYPDHGETLALKGLNMAYMDKKDEAFDCVKRGVKADVTSWQMHALVHRQYREHPEATRCFQMALRNCPKDNKEKWLQLLKELAVEQMMSGDYRGFVQSRKQYLDEKPGQPPNWMSSVVGAQLLGDLAGAVRLLDAYESLVTAEKRETFEEKYTYSEMMMYKISLLEQIGEYDRAMSLLSQKAPELLDRLAVQEQRGNIHLKRKEFADAEKIYRELLAGNTENLAYHRKLLESLQIASFQDGEEKLIASAEKLLMVYTQLSEKHPKSHAVVNFPLRFLTGTEFRTRFEAAVQPHLRKGVPALFNSCKPLYKDASRVRIIEEVINSYITSLRANNKFPGSDKEEDPTVLLWALVFAAQHFNEVEQWVRAFELIDEAIKHTPTIIDLYVFKSRFYKKAGDPETAAALMEKSRQLDFADRYLNVRSSRYLLRAGQTEKAERVVSIFTTDMETGYNNLNDMQVSWWKLNLADAYARLGQPGLALKQYLAVEKDYNTIFEDQYDFHSYCARKQTLRAYVDLIHLEENLHGQRAYARAIRGAVETYLTLHTSAKAAESAHEDPAEAKKAEAKRKKAEAARKAEEEEAAKKRAQEQARANAKRKGRAPPVDTDPNGEQLVKVADPLAEAAKHLRKIYSHNTKRIEVQLTAFEVYFAQKRLLLALQSIKRSLALAPKDARVHKAIVRFFHLVANTKDVNATVATIVLAERDAILGSQDLVAYNKAYATANASSIAARTAAAEMSVLLNASEKAAAVKTVSDATGTGVVADFVTAHKLLSSWDAAAGSAYKETVLRTRLPYATYFGAVRPKEEEEPKDD